jgi:hypothetical protein
MAKADFNSTGLSLFRKEFEFQYSPKHQPEFFIATGRLVLATFSLLAVWIDPSVPVRDAQIVYVLFAGYVAYSLLLTLFILRRYLKKSLTPS